MCDETLSNIQNQQQREKHTVHWFRKGLRLHDNPALKAGIKGATTLRCIFVIDPWFAGSSNVGINKWRFLLQCLEDLDRGLRKLNSRLFVIRGQPADALPKLFKEWSTTCLTFEEDPEPYGKVRDQNVSEMCKELGIEVILAISHTLYKLDTIIEKNNARAPLTYHKFQEVIASMNPPSQSEASITSELLGSTYTPILDDHDEKYNVPTLDELGFDTEGLKPPVWYGGETEALARLERHLERKAWVASFGRPKMTPQSLLATQTGLSPYLRFGCLSTRLFYHQLTELYKKIKNTMPPLSLHGQLLWREFFYCAATRNPSFDKMEGNQICVQIPWDKNPEALAKWANGQTGFPWIDAIMTQLREEGWIHHLARHAVACFLTRGDLWMSWEEGMKVFEELLLDADWSNNAGMWMWLSGSSFFQQFFHCYCPVRFGRKADPNGDYIRRFLPVLKNFPTKFIHEPWIAPESVQRAAKCVIGKDYPVPMVNHAVVSRLNMERMKQVYQHLTSYRAPAEQKINSPTDDSLIAGILGAAANTQSYIPYAVSSPSPTTVIANTNNSGSYLCQQVRRNRPTSTVISSDYHQQQQQQQQMQQQQRQQHQQQQQQQHQQQQQQQQQQLQQHQQQQQQQQQQQIQQQHQQHQENQQYYLNETSGKSSSTVNDFVKMQQQRQAATDSDCMSINLYDNMRQLQHNNHHQQQQHSFNQKQQHHLQHINYENQRALTVNVDNIKHQHARSSQQYHRMKLIDDMNNKDLQNNSNNSNNNNNNNNNNNTNRYKTDQTSDDLSFRKQYNLNNSLIMNYGYNNSGNNEYTSYSNDFPGLGATAGSSILQNQQSLQNDRTHFNSNINGSNNKLLTHHHQHHMSHLEQHQQQQQQQLQMKHTNEIHSNNLELNFKCDLDEHDK